MERDPKVVSYTMSRIRSKNTGIELKLRKALTEKGIKYRLYSKKFFGHPDIVINKYRLAIFADSEFWHGYNFDENLCAIKTHQDFWIPKIKRNIERDKKVNEVLASQGYVVLRFWGFEIEKELDRVVEKIEQTISLLKEMEDLKSKIISKTTLVYIQNNEKYLLMYRNKKKNDPNHGKYIGVGGHIEKGESPIACMKREVFEETGLTVEKYSYKGLVNFLNRECECERMFLYKVTSFSGQLKECDEGELVWIDKKEIQNLPMWDGDRTFLPVLDMEGGPFKTDLLYEGDNLMCSIGPYAGAKRVAKEKKSLGPRRKNDGKHSN